MLSRHGVFYKLSLLPRMFSFNLPFAAKCLTTGFLAGGETKQNHKKKSPICSICQFLWCKYSHHGQFHTINMMSLNTELGREALEFPAELFQILEDDSVKVLHSICQQIWKTQQGPQDWERWGLIPIPKKDSGKECSNYHTVAFMSNVSKVRLKIL